MRGQNTNDQQAMADRRRRVAQLTAEGHDGVYISRVLNVCRKTIERDRKILGLSAPKALPMTPQELARAREMLDEGCNYAEVGRTIDRSPTTIQHHLPGYQLDKYQIAELGANGRWLARLERTG